MCSLQVASEQHLDTAVFTAEEWDNHQKNTVYLDPWEQHLVLWDCLEQPLTGKRGQLWRGWGRVGLVGGREGGWNLSSNSRYGSQGLAHNSHIRVRSR